ncbi:rhomboid-like protein 11, chloroplastic isoform X1 [Hevea brasiliensis]|uniref:rhomboid-like protein 11, chloroplastic isoform X1 n=1 Tax=Hevea brasiliensis TaxID=3981 RepID=UPI0025FE9A1A|nr:rhomboid-like protein 11, chloroplastic isoform X1 [Hevea brasiliensis]
MMGLFRLRLHQLSTMKPCFSCTFMPMASYSSFSNSLTVSPHLSAYPKLIIAPANSPCFLPSFPVVRSRFVCKMNGSDMIRQLELDKPEERRKPEKRANGVFWIILLNLGIYVADHFFQVRGIKSLYLYHNWPAWYQFVTATFCHASWEHLSSNLFFLYIFGKLVEEEEGNFALWLSYILTGVGANLVSWLVLPRNAVSVGASGAVFGLFAISVLVKITWDWRKILEVLILGQFVIEKVLILGVTGNGGSPSFSGIVRHFTWRLPYAECQSYCTSIWCSYWCGSGVACQQNSLCSRPRNIKIAWQIRQNSIRDFEFGVSHKCS